MLLTVEISPTDPVVKICCDREGLEVLRGQIDQLERKDGHVHLMTPSWAGHELTEQGQIEGYSLAHHLKILRGAE